MPFVIRKMFASKPEKAFLFLMRELGYTQRDAQRFISVGRVIVNGEPIVNSASIISGAFDFITFEPVTRGLKPLAEYEKFVVFDKPSGLLIHPQNRHTPYSLIDELKYQFGSDANIAHRIDQETSGLVLCAKDKESEIELKMLFQERDMKKKYLAMVHGKLDKTLSIDAPLLRFNDEKSALVRMVVKVDPAGKESLTLVRPLEYFPDRDTTLVECAPHTGRQHQIRVHLFHMKHPIVGDPVYGQSEANLVRYLDRDLSRDERVILSGARRLLLHANELEFCYQDKSYHIRSDVDFVKICLENMQ